VALYLVSTLRRKGMDANGNMADEPGYDPQARPIIVMDTGHNPHAVGPHPKSLDRALKDETWMALESTEEEEDEETSPDIGREKQPLLTPELLHEVFLNPGIYLLMAGIAIGFISGKQGYSSEPDRLFIYLFPALLCLFLLEMGMTASRKIRDLKAAGWQFVAYALLAPNIYATIGIFVAHIYSMVTHQHFDVGTYVLFSVLCGAASYIAVPAVQRMAIPEASPTLPLAASLGLTFSYNVTIGIPVYIQIAKLVMKTWPVT
jgi:hypothetical protein